MSLIELMVVVVIIGILATLAVFLYTRHMKKARASEVHDVLAEFRLKQEQFYVENGSYVQTGADETDIFPPNPSTKDAVSAAGPPAAWSALRIDTGKSHLWCGFVAIAGAANDGTNIGPVAADMGFAAPNTDWFYVVAECPFNGATYVITSTTDRVWQQ
jgi:prepilin-type N-terminal cleavage/methylation domain-containing protein